jgi:predicted molibdopterin-dependent oxidoreductase YjgC
LAAAARGDIGGLVLVGADPRADYPDATAAAEGLDGARFVVAVDTFLTESSRRADVILPAAGYAERRGTFTNLEGRNTWLAQMVTAPGVAWPDWMIATEVAAALGVDLGFASVEEIWSEIERVSPLHRGAVAAVIASRDGVVVPVRDDVAPARIRPLDPMADPGIASAVPPPLPPGALAARPLPALVLSEAAEPGLPLPPMLSVAPPPPVSSAPAPDGYSLRLVARRSLWDAGTQAQHAPALAALHPDWQLAVHPSELERLGVASGTEVRVTSPRGTLVLAAKADATVPRGVAVIPWNLPQASASALIDSRAPVTNVRLASIGASAGGDGHG